jgi:YVTN family beta-propeller protein
MRKDVGMFGGATPRVAWLALLVAGVFQLGVDCSTPGSVPLPGSGAALYTSAQTNPVALSADGTLLFVANTTSGSLSVLDVSSPAAPVELAKIKVGHDPVGVAVRPKVNPGDAGEDELVLVTNHISDTVSVVSRQRLDVIQTIQELDANGVTTTDEPTGVAFASPYRAFVTLDNPNQVLVLDLDAAGNATINPTRLTITAQAPRALAVAGGRLFVAPFESNNQTEFPSCSPEDTRGLNTNPAVFDQGCQFKLRIADAFTLSPLTLNPGPLFDFATSPNIGGRVIHDGDNPDRDLFVYDATSLGLVGTVSGIGTLQYGLAVGNSGNRIFVTNTDARNVNNGLSNLGNRMFDNRLAYVDCIGGCTSFSAPTKIDLDAAAPGSATFPTPYGIAVSGDGNVLVATAAGSDGVAGWNGASGLFTLNPAGGVLGSVRVGAIPQGVALRSNGAGVAQTAFVLNTVDSTVSVVNVSSPAAPSVLATVTVGGDPTPTAVKRGRIAFSSARGSTSGTFSCESCHPNGNTDQLLWTINAVAGPGGSDPGGVVPEPRSTMPVRGLRDTLPLHWDGSLGDPISGAFVPGDTAPDCSLASGDLACFRHLVNASLSGVMCSQPACVNGPSGAPGAFTSQERDDMATFLGAVAYPPSPKRQPSDALSTNARQGFRDFFTDDDGQGVAHSVGQLIGFAPMTCADNTLGCHKLPLTVSTNSQTVGRFDAPSIRGLWDRYVIFSNGLMSSQEGMVLAQNCANGINPPGQPLSGDPCNPLFLNPVYPTGETVWDPNAGITERGAFMGSFEVAFNLFYGVRGNRIWDFINEMSVGLPALAGRQLELRGAGANAPATVSALAEIEAAAAAGKITAVARNATMAELRFRPETGLWTSSSGGAQLTGAGLRSLVVSSGLVVTITADLPQNVAPAGPRQPLLSPEGVEAGGQVPPLPRPTGGSTAVIRLAQSYVDPAAKVLVDGVVCSACSVALTTNGSGLPVADITLAPAPPAASGAHALQVLNPNGLASNEMPIVPQ